ncbi:MAG: hypothetical protein CML69_15610 [Rhodobacteraceae bacterium]|nr:hypothetical protein [Paracoccaceae bacterium]
MNIYTFPPAPITGWLPNEELPTRRSEYAMDGKRAVSTAGPARRTLQLTCGALGRGHNGGAGYLAQLWRYIDGGVGLVRLNLPPTNWHLDQIGLRRSIGNRVVPGVDGGNPVVLVNGVTPVTAFGNTRRTAAPLVLAGYPHAVTVTGLPPNIIVARPGDIVRVWDAGTPSTARVLDLTRSDADGVAEVPVSAALPAGVIAFADEESAVFEVLEYKPGAQAIGQNWSIGLSLREQLDSEISDPVEVNPWR